MIHIDIPDCKVMSYSDTYWAFARDVAFKSGNKYVSYELLKKEYSKVHPEASPAEYDAAMTKLAALCGV